MSVATRRAGRGFSAHSMVEGGLLVLLAAVLIPLGTLDLAAQDPPDPDWVTPRGVVMDPDRARQLYVSNVPEDMFLGRDLEADIERRMSIQAIYEEVTEGVVDFQMVEYRSSVGDLDIPAYLYQPLEKRGDRGHPALIWVHGGVRGLWTANYWPFVKEAVERGYVVIAPEYRGSIGWGEEHHAKFDYGGYEVDDNASAYDWMVENLPHVDPERVAMIGWSHGGYNSLLAVSRPPHPFKAAVAVVPVSNLIFRLSYKGPNYQHHFSTGYRLQGLPFEHREEYVYRSPVYQVDNIEVPVLVHLADNDQDVNFEEAEMLVHALQVKKPNLAETKIYHDPQGGHSFDRQVDMETLTPQWTPHMRDSWNRIWAFLEWNLRPYEDGSGNVVEDAEQAAGR
jgi:dipeptidyl aminopeptidase/acylaminoacyl peptidase